MQTLCLFVTATDTGVGKTWLTALIARSLRERGLRVGAYKPVCSGAEIDVAENLWWGDVKELAAAIGGDFDNRRVCPSRLKAPLAPPVAARHEGIRLDFGKMQEGAAWWLGRVDVLLIEGVGGLLCPLTEEHTIADLAQALNCPLLVVARLGLGTINHALLTVEAARNRDLPVRGVVLNEAQPLASDLGIDENSLEIARRANVPVLGVVRHGETSLSVDWLQVVSGAQS